MERVGRSLLWRVGVGERVSWNSGVGFLGGVIMDGGAVGETRSSRHSLRGLVGRGMVGVVDVVMPIGCWRDGLGLACCAD